MASFLVIKRIARMQRMWKRMVQFPRESTGRTSLRARGREVMGVMPRAAFFMSTTPKAMVQSPRMYLI